MSLSLHEAYKALRLMMYRYLQQAYDISFYAMMSVLIRAQLKDSMRRLLQGCCERAENCDIA